jgi:dTDP-4-amino-4,6-dideoxy-D-galactose acyltransferase
MSNPHVQLLAWDSNWLGFPVARVGGGALDSPAEVMSAIDSCRATGIRLIYLVLNPDHAAANRAAAHAGAQLVDVKVTYGSTLPDASALVPAPPATQLTRAKTVTPMLERLAVQSGEHSRFKLDTRISTAHFETLYTQWLQRTLDQGVVWVAATGSESLGLLAYAGYEGYASIELLAVSPSARRRGIGQFLVQVAKHHAQEQGYSWLQVVTQGANQPARTLYERCGFQLLRSEHVYHLWL